LLTGLSSWIARRADERDDRHRGLELAASVAAVRVDAAVNRAATTLAFAGDDVDVDRLADAIGVPVCREGVRSGCAQPGGPTTAESAEAFRDPATERAATLAAAASRDAGSAAAAVVAADSPSTGTAIVVVVQLPGSRTVALLPIEPGLVVLGTGSSSEGRTVSAPLTTDFANGEWSTHAVSDHDIGPAAGLTWLTTLEVIAGALITLAALAAMTQDQRRLRRRATIDALTGLPNRADFERRAARRLTDLARDGRGACLIVVDLDGFKSINDSLGHQAGDDALCEVARRLRCATRAADTIARFGGDEFAVLCEGVDRPTAAVVAGRIDAHLRLPFAIDDVAVALRGSIGITLSTPGATAEDVLRAADAAMYSKKHDAKVSASAVAVASAARA
jgi:diguanylate cyclase (GGDEF)-like protein